MSETPGPPSTPVALRARLQAAARPQRAQIGVGLLLALVGFGAVVQARSAGAGELSGLRQTELVRILDDSEARSEQLREEQRTLQAELDQLRGGTDTARAAAQEAQRRADDLGILSGTIPAQGPGVQLSIPDPQRVVRAVDLLDTVQELRDAGAEAIQIGDVRVVVATAFTDGGGGVLVGGRLIRAPYQLRAIGPAADLESALGIPGGVLDSLADARPRVTRQERVVVDALHR